MSDTALTGSSAPPVITTEFIGPREARLLLEESAPNRRVNDNLVLKYACAMLDEDWHNIGVPLIFDGRGRLTDGQHRLHAVVESDTVQMFTRGLIILIDYIIFSKCSMISCNFRVPLNSLISRR